MNKIFATTALALAMSATAIATSTSFAQTNAPAGRMMGMPGGGCPMTEMMGQGMMGRGTGIVEGRAGWMSNSAPRCIAPLYTLKIGDACDLLFQ